MSDPFKSAWEAHTKFWGDRENLRRLVRERSEADAAYAQQLRKRREKADLAKANAKLWWWPILAWRREAAR